MAIDSVSPDCSLSLSRAGTSTSMENRSKRLFFIGIKTGKGRMSLGPDFRFLPCFRLVCSAFADRVMCMLKFVGLNVRYH